MLFSGLGSPEFPKPRSVQPRVGRGFPAFAGYPDVTQSAVLDRNHLAHITLGDEALEREVLGLFHLQAAMLLGRMANQAPRVIAALAHTLTGSARGIGAWQVAAAAEAVERAAAGREQAGIEGAIGRLSAAVTQVQAAIAGLTQVC